MEPRLAEERDLLELTQQMTEFYEEFQYFPLNVEKAVQFVYDQVAAKRVIVLEKDGKIIGSMCWDMQRYWYSDIGPIINVWTYIVPEERGKDDGIKYFLEAGRYIAETSNVPFLFELTDWSKPRPTNKRMARIAEKALYVPMGHQVMMAEQNGDVT